MFNGDNYTIKHMYAWGDQYVIKPKLNLSISEGVKYCFHNNFFKNKTIRCLLLSNMVSIFRASMNLSCS
jgi:hypothetical protein